MAPRTGRRIAAAPVLPPRSTTTMRTRRAYRGPRALRSRTIRMRPSPRRARRPTKRARRSPRSACAVTVRANSADDRGARRREHEPDRHRSEPELSERHRRAAGHDRRRTALPTRSRAALRFVATGDGPSVACRCRSLARPSGSTITVTFKAGQATENHS